jgi:trk system potassium uptake protein TrkH
VWLGVFHSVSAFCNAGFALFSDSFVGFRDDPALLAVVGSLIVLGGLGFVVLYALWRRGAYGGLRSLSVQVKAVILSTVVLVLGGWAIYGTLEWQQTLAGLSFADKATNALFQSVTLRTAGFNSVDFTDLSPATGLVMMLFMFIGASPGSTGGGIKTTTLVVLVAATFAMARGPGIVRLFDRELARATVYRALAILMASVGIVFATFFLLLVFEGQGLDALPFHSLLFEAFSAVGTVGLSLGATAQLGPMGKMVIIVAMFIGRVGPLTLALLLSTVDREQRIRHARARIMVG